MEKKVREMSDDELVEEFFTLQNWVPGQDSRTLQDVLARQNLVRYWMNKRMGK